MTVTTCPHGLAQHQKFGTEERNGLTYCRRCGLPTADSLLEWQREAQSPVSGSSAEPESELSELRALVRQASSRNQTLEGIRIGIFLLLGLHALVVLLFTLGVIRIEVVVFR